MKNKKDSPAVALLRHTWNSINSGGKGGGWDRINHAMRHTLELAVGAGFEFRAGDWETIANDFRAAYWTGESGFEWAYSLAITVGNSSAWETLEARWGRKPIIADRVTPDDRYRNNPWQHSGGSERQRERLAVGFTVDWKGEKCQVTSFNEKGAAICCSYQNEERVECEKCHHIIGGYGRKLLRRYTLTPEVVQHDRADRKERDEIEAKLANAESPSEVIAWLGLDKSASDNRKRFYSLPIAKLRKAVEKFCKEAA